MSNKKMLLLVGVLMAAALVLSACAGPAGSEGPAGPAGPAGAVGPAGADGAPAMAADLTCSECHDDGGLLAGKVFAWEGSLHGSGTSAAYAGGRSGCSGCHSGSDFSAMVAAGLTPPTAEFGDNITRQDCRTCHAVHTSYTAADWALETTDAITLYSSSLDFDGGKGNLCANCHQSRRQIEVTDADTVIWTSSHYGPHHGPQSDMLLGSTGAGEVEGKPSAHYSMVENTCVSCHLGEGADHTFAPDIAACTACHADLESFDLNGVQTEVQEKLDLLLEKLEEAGLYHDGHAVTSDEAGYPAGQASALWNYIFIAVEDGSLGVHNAKYTLALLDWSLAQFE
jgi:hypothetical protein